MKSFLLALLCIATAPLMALTVNHLNGSVNIMYIDFSIPGPVLPVELARAYNSITATNENRGWNGSFGWGWSSLPETTLNFTGDRRVLLRDGLSGNTLTFAAEKDDPKIRSEFMSAVKRAYFEQKYSRAISEKELSRLSLPRQVQSQLLASPRYRAEIAVKYNIKSPIPRGEVLVSTEFGYQTVEFRDGYWVRTREGISQYFDQDGRIVRQVDKNGFAIVFRYSTTQKNQVLSIDSEDKTASLRFTWKKDRIVLVVDNRNLSATYTYDPQGNLVSVKDSANQIVNYHYQNKRMNHLITRIDSTSNDNKKRESREIRYDENGLIVFYKAKEGAETTYSYGKSPSDPQDNFWTKYVTKFSDGTTEDLYDEYTIKTQPSGLRYLYRQETRKNGKTTVTLFTACCGTPSRVTENGVVTEYQYYADGLLMEKSSPFETLKLEYDPRWKKITKITQNTLTSVFKYDGRGNLVAASNSRKESVNLDYDRYGRITRMRSPSGSHVSFRYGNLGKPILIEDKEVGTIRITYDPSGKIIRAETVSPKVSGRKLSRKEPREIIQSVMKGFRSLLDIIRPAGVQLPVG